MALNERSLKNLQGVHPDLVRVVKLAAEREPFIVTEGVRTIERQKQLKAAGKSWTLNSRHLNGHAIDVVDPDGKYDIPDMDHIAVVMKGAAAELGVPITWGGDWKSRDTPHFELDWKAYPETGMSFVSRIKETAVDVATSKPGVVTTGVGVGAGIAENADKIPAPPDLTSFTAWKVFSQTAIDLGSWVWGNPTIVVMIGGWIAGTLYWPKIKATIGGAVDAIAEKRRAA
ncbi:M15 family metallopeptidase [Hyphomicrobium sp. CS1GBMeth3]|uniref:M15 family metallopeptidase n=1 Tax=Hyphomicrobium sp. CS1GBMeth3 TaxID=1892845 RepID=UPI001AECEFBB|nr:M15 family metallopeptidase [Hyphomicrobium sp. CS1GBMeth3]